MKKNHLNLYIFLIFVLTILKIKFINNLRLNKDDSLKGIPDDQLEGELKKYGVTNKDIELLSRGNSKLDLLKDNDRKFSDGVLARDNNDLNFKQKNIKILKNFNLKKEQIKKLLNVFQNHTMFFQLPVSAMNIVSNSTTNLNEDYNYLNNFNNKLISNTLNSQVFVDSDNKVGRKGLLTLLNGSDNYTNGIYEHMWVIVNSKVLCFYNTHQYLNIKHLFRIANIKIINPPFSPCFMIRNKETLDKNSNKVLACALNFKEKEFWIDTIKYHIKQYNNYNINK